MRRRGGPETDADVTAGEGPEGISGVWVAAWKPPAGMISKPRISCRYFQALQRVMPRMLMVDGIVLKRLDQRQEMG